MGEYEVQKILPFKIEFSVSKNQTCETVSKDGGCDMGKPTPGNQPERRYGVASIRALFEYYMKINKWYNPKQDSAIKIRTNK